MNDFGLSINFVDEFIKIYSDNKSKNKEIAAICNESIKWLMELKGKEVEYNFLNERDFLIE